MLATKQLHRLHVGPITLQVDGGSCVSIVGRSGSGKSVLLRMIADLDPHEGDVLLDGEACSGMPAPQWRRRVSYVAAASGWWNDKVGPHFRDAAALRELLPRVGLAPDVGEWEVARLSTGERQRLALLRAMTPENRVLLLDEPTSGLDAESTWLVEELLRERLAQGTTLLLVTHDPQQAVRLAHRRYRLADGQLQESS
ncbi:ATP-binding cassette domain-containing protein [Ramlibacter ginsenosidimutans]|uniref:ATP-binding cassette domain-containing protein n=1 Tax=Ramlibacter ginsenosidimutans TaxID=502333 RepID=A0A934TVJ1_9BURK|nr:ATP-binding cassette domain-containing protein [Ramlibacter ginsenosidimutans]MBK6008085.1 ATP-binding cassette domain-containing protein [Ramlibacter ginsenosidimutans]